MASGSGADKANDEAPTLPTGRGWRFGWRRRANRAALATAAEQLYGTIVAQARAQVFYDRYGIPDTPDGRYDMIVLHAVLVFRRLAAEERAAELAQALFDRMFVDFDESLREMGVGDLRVGKQVKALAKGLYGRIVAYGTCLDTGDHRGLTEALARNVFRHRPPEPEALATLTGYVEREARRIAGAPLSILLQGRVGFDAPPLPLSGR